MFRKLLPAILVLSLAVMACGVNINFPQVGVTTGPTVVDDINVPAPSGVTGSVDLSLAFGAGTLDLKPGSTALVSGTATYNVADFKPTVTADGSNVRIEQGNWKVTGIPNFNNIKNEWDLTLGSAPINLSIEAGAYKADYEFGGLSLTNLTVKDGAAESKIDFSSPNAATMELLRYETGASSVSLSNLGNANFSRLEFTSGAGNYTLDFTGALKQDASVSITTGVSNMILRIPAGVPAQVTVEGGLSNVTPASGWTKNGNVYTQSGEGHELVITIKIGAGNLTLSQ